MPANLSEVLSILIATSRSDWACSCPLSRGPAACDVARVISNVLAPVVSQRNCELNLLLAIEIGERRLEFGLRARFMTTDIIIHVASRDGSGDFVVCATIQGRAEARPNEANKCLVFNGK